MSEHLYFIAAIPPTEIQEEITSLKHIVSKRFGSKHALRSPPHITLHMPFKWKDKKIDALYEVIQELNDQLKPFDIALKGFDFFVPRVVFINVIENERLTELQAKTVDHCRKQLKLENANYKNRPFPPHVTIGFRDLRKNAFYEARDYFQNQEASFNFLVDRIFLLKHNGQQWEVVNI